MFVVNVVLNRFIVNNGFLDTILLDTVNGGPSETTVFSARPYVCEFVVFLGNLSLVFLFFWMMLDNWKI